MINLEEELLNSGKRHWINFKDPSGETEREMFFCVEDYLMQKKALEIIRSKRVNLEYLKCCETYEQYKTVCSYHDEINQNEFDSLKEILS